MSLPATSSAQNVRRVARYAIGGWLGNCWNAHPQKCLCPGLIAADTAEVRARLDGLPLDRKRSVIDTLLTVTILPGQKRGALRTDLVPITWKD
jgi:hypothetical protein